NYYEQSKRFAENIIYKHIKTDGLNAYVLRPSQVVGNNITGVTKTGFGIFDFTKRVCNLAVRYPNERVKIKVKPDSTQNLMPVNTVTCYLMSFVETQNMARVINLVSKRPVKNSEIIDYINETLPINIIPCKQLAKNSMTSLERLIDIGMSFTGEYSNVNLVFDTTNLDKTMPIKVDEITQDSLRKMLGYFIGGNLLNKKVNQNAQCTV
ncbi:MAG: SDR family oxidoreductase, partial [Bacteroidota bacterium]